MKKIIIIAMAMALIMGGIGIAYGGTLELEAAGTGPAKVINDSAKLIKSTRNILRQVWTDLETALGKPLGQINRADADAYFGITISDTVWADMQKAGYGIKNATLALEALDLPATND